MSSDIFKSNAELVVYIPTPDMLSKVEKIYPMAYRQYFTKPYELGTLVIIDVTPTQKHALMFVEKDDGTIDEELLKICCNELRSYIQESKISTQNVRSCVRGEEL